MGYREASGRGYVPRHASATRAASNARDDYPGNNISKDAVELRRLTYAKSDRDPAMNTFRLLPAPLREEPGVWTPCREEAVIPGAPADLGPWIQAYMVMRLSGCSFIIYDPRQYNSETDGKFDSPAFVVAYAARKAKKEGVGAAYWSALQEGSAKGPAALDLPKTVFFAYALVHEAGKDTFDPPRGLDANSRPVLLDLGADVGRKVTQMTNHLKPNSEGLPFAKRFEMPDPVRLDRGVLFRAFSKEAKDPRPAERAAAPNAKYWDAPVQEREMGRGYHLYAVREWNGKTAGIDEAEWDQLHRRLIPIEEALLFPDPIQQVEFLCKHLEWKGQPCIDLLEYAFRDARYDEWRQAIPSSAKAIAKGKVTSAPKPKAAPQPEPDDEDDENDDTPTYATPSSSRKPAPAHEPDDEDEDEDDEELTTHAAPSDPALPRGAMPAGDGLDLDDEDDDDDDDDDDGPVAGPQFEEPPAPSTKSKVKQALERLKNKSSSR